MHPTYRDLAASTDDNCPVADHSPGQDTRYGSGCTTGQASVLGNYAEWPIEQTTAHRTGWGLSQASSELRRNHATHPVLTGFLVVFGDEPAGCRRRNPVKGRHENCWTYERAPGRQDRGRDCLRKNAA